MAAAGAEADAAHRRFRGIAGSAHVVFGVLLPVVTLGFELFTNASAIWRRERKREVHRQS